MAGAVAGAAGIGIASGAQHGDDGRELVAAHAVRVFPRHRFRLQQASARLRLSRDQRRKPDARYSGRQRSVHRHLCRRHGGGADRVGCGVGTDRAERQADSSDRRLSPGPRRYSAYRNGAVAWRDDHGDRHSGLGGGEAVVLLEGPRPGEFRVRSGVRRSGVGPRWREDPELSEWRPEGWARSPGDCPRWRPR